LKTLRKIKNNSMTLKKWNNLKSSNVLCKENLMTAFDIEKQSSQYEKSVKAHIKNCKGELTGDLLVMCSQFCFKCNKKLTDWFNNLKT